MEPQVESRPSKRRRTEYGKRSKQGCRTCISKKVKCDEQIPHCGRCDRLGLQCTWTTTPLPPLSSRRRGHGPIKARGDWTPRTIQPSPATTGDCVQPEEGLPMVPSDADSPSDICALDADPAQQDYRPEAEGLSQIQDLEEWPGRRASDTLEHLPASSSNSLRTAVELDSLLVTRRTVGRISNIMPGTWEANDEGSECQQDVIYGDTSMLLPFPNVALDPWPACGVEQTFAPLFSARVLPPVVEGSDLSAMAFYRVVFAPLKSTRTSALSAHSIFLDRAVVNNMAMHFLLALSHSEFAIYQGQGIRMPQRSWLHFQCGSQLLFEAGRTVTQQSDHVGMLLSFLYMYMFWMRRDPFNRAIIRDLSRLALSYVRTHGLDDLGAIADLVDSDKVLLCRILTYLYDRDGFCYFFGCGGAFSSYVNENPNKRRQIWQLSRQGFLWSENQLRGQPSLSLETSTDMRGTNVTDIYFQLISIHHDVSCYSQQVSEEQLEDMGSRIECILERVPKDQQALFHMVAEYGDGEASSRPSLMTLVTVTFYHAIRIYFYRCRDSGFGKIPVPSRVQASLSALIRTAFHAVTTGEVQLLERFQWALWIAGIETRDPVHRDWIMRNMADPSMKKALKCIVDTMDTRKGCISMQEIRDLVYTTRSFSI